MKKRLVFVRHGRQDSSRCNADVKLSPEGILQAELLEKRLQGSSFDIMYTSTLLRAMETGYIINRSLSLDVARRDGLNEIDWGDIVGLNSEERIQRYSAFMKERLLRTSDLPFPGGESGEDAYRRALPVIKEMINSPHENILIVSHGGMIRSLIAGLLGLPFKDKLAFGSSLENTSLTEFLYDSETGLFTLEVLNDHAHLMGHPELMRNAWKEK
ncbi:MAG: histidine phosphatase family protein [Bullifex sp.]